jgi:hypothetical protein
MKTLFCVVLLALSLQVLAQSEPNEPSPSRDSEYVPETRPGSADDTYRYDSDGRSYVRTSEGRYIREDNQVCYGENEMRCYP